MAKKSLKFAQSKNMIERFLAKYKNLISIKSNSRSGFFTRRAMLTFATSSNILLITYSFYNISSKSHDWVQNLCLNELFCWHHSQIKSVRTCFAFSSVGNNNQSDIFFAFCWYLTFLFHITLIMLSVLLAC